MSSSPIPNPRAAITGIKRNIRATMKIRNANDLRNINTDCADFTFIFAIRVLFGSGLCRRYFLFCFECLNASSQIRHEIAVIFLPQFRTRPVAAFDLSAAILAAAITGELIIGGAITHCIIEVDFFASFDIAHRDDTNLPGKPGIGFAGMVETIRRFQWIGGDQIKIIFDLKNSLCKVWHMRIEFILCRNAASEKSEQLAFLNWLAGKYTASAFLFELARVTFRV